ncbi:MAG: glycosyltransferase [Bacteroidota bacterium]|nr:glycosyltransferase [Bacteroidota bacterium]
MQLSVIIVSYNVKYFLEQCLLSVLKAMKNIDGEIIVVDNHSTDDSFLFFEEKFKDVNFIWNTSNSGFAKANNQALKIASGDYILFLNPDTLLPEDCFEKCISFIQLQKNDCALGIKMIDGSGKFLKESKRAFPSPMTSLYKLSGFAKLFPHSKIFAKYHLGYLCENENHEVDVLAGAFMMIPKKILNVVNGFDEAFFMYGEDVDLSFRIQQAGFKNFYFAESSIIHFKGESTKKGSLNYVKMFYKAMSIFVKKHYGSTRARLFNLFIQAAIFLRAGMSIIAHFLKWIGMPVIDAGIILFSFWSMTFFWSTLIRHEINYPSHLLFIAFPAFTILFLAASYFAGLYDNDYRQSRLNKSALVAILINLSFYSLLPERLRFSRGILLFGSILAFLLMTLVRRLLLKWNIIESAAERDEINQTIIAGAQEEFNRANYFLKNSGKKERVLGRIGTSRSEDTSAIGKIKDIADILHSYPVKEIIFCEGTLSFKTIIETIPTISHHVRIKYFATGSHTIIGSDDKDVTGEFITEDENYHLANAVYRRSKNWFDLILSLIFLILFPFLVFIKNRPAIFLKNIMDVLLRKKSWIGYAGNKKSLPELLPGIITTTGLPHSLNSLPMQSLFKTDKLYAKHFRILHDLRLIWKNFNLLS